MKKKRIIHIIVTIALTIIIYLFINYLFARDENKYSKGEGSDYGNSRSYKANTVETLIGKIVKIKRIVIGDKLSYIIHIVVQTAAETISVHLGPGWYIEKVKKFKIKEYDEIQIKGSRIDFAGTPAIIAAELWAGNKSVKLRDENGYPYWNEQKK